MLAGVSHYVSCDNLVNFTLQKTPYTAEVREEEQEKDPIAVASAFPFRANRIQNMKEPEKEQNPVRLVRFGSLESSSSHTLKPQIKEKETTVYGGFSKRFCAVNQNATQLIHTEKSYEDRTI